MAETGYTQNRPEIVCGSNMDFSSDEEGYASPYSGWSDEDNAHISNRQLMDELPIFSTQSLSPSGRSLSPIDVDFSSPPRSSRGNNSSVYNTPFDSPSQMIPIGKDFVTLEEIQARIGMTPPAEQDPERCRSPRLNLETIFEDKFLETPPKNAKESRTNRDLLRRSFRNRPPVLGTMTVMEAECSVSAIESLGQQFGNKFKVGLD